MIQAAVGEGYKGSVSVVNTVEKLSWGWKRGGQGQGRNQRQAVGVVYTRVRCARGGDAGGGSRSHCELRHLAGTEPPACHWRHRTPVSRPAAHTGERRLLPGLAPNLRRALSTDQDSVVASQVWPAWAWRRQH